MKLSVNRNHAYEPNQCKGKPYVRTPNNNRNQTYVWKHMYGFVHSFVSDYFSEGNIKFDPNIGLTNRFGFDLIDNFGYIHILI
jgi:hypothetical protein